MFMNESEGHVRRRDGDGDSREWLHAHCVLYFKNARKNTLLYGLQLYASIIQATKCHHVP